jgi:outer membrane receptor protein involved in Fe transport
MGSDGDLVWSAFRLDPVGRQLWRSRRRVEATLIRLAICFLAGLLSAVPAMAQQGGISGTVVDETGASLPGATVVVTGRGVTRTLYTAGDGRFTITGLPSGTYQVAVSLSGFSTNTRGVTVGATVTDAPVTLSIASLAETIVVSASRIETTILNAPATMSVVSSESIAAAPSQSFGDLLRNVPGMNVIQTSARDFNVTSRQSTGTASTSQLVLVDGRSVYLDFFGLVAWDFVPTDPNDIKQIEVVRGPASAVWGANALTGVVNIITKSPREAARGSFLATGGGFSRDAGSREGTGAGSTFGLSASVSRALSDVWSFRATAGYAQSAPYSRPVGLVPLDRHPLDARVQTGGAAYPLDGAGPAGQAFENTGTEQPKVDVRVDQSPASGGLISYSGGYAGTSGIVHTGVGPFSIQNGSYLTYGRATFSKNALRVAAFANFLDAKAPNLLLTDPLTLRPVQLDFRTRTFDVEVSHATAIGGRHVMSYGGNVRRNNFAEISIAPQAENRIEIGAYAQEDFSLSNVRLAVGGRVDKFGNLDAPAFSPRLSATFKPRNDHALRLSWNKAFRSPSAVNNFLALKIFAPIAPIDLRPLRPILPPALAALVPSAPIPLVVNTVGNPNLRAESLKAFEVAYTATLNDRTTVSVAWYQNTTDDSIDFSSVTPSVSYPQGLPPFDVYTAANSAETGIDGVLYGALVASRVPGFPLPRTVSTYLNLPPIRQRGIELSLDHRHNEHVTASLNYSFQGDPTFPEKADALPYPPEEAGLAARHRFNAMVTMAQGRFIESASINVVGRAFWVDVLGTPYSGYSDAYTMLNGYFGVKWLEGKLTTAVKGVDLTNETIQQHIFGDLLKRSVVGELRVRF